MNEGIAIRAPIWFRAVALVALAWYLLGVYLYLRQVGIAGGPAISTEDQAIISTTTAWVTASFAIAVFAGAIGTLGLVLLRKWSRPVLLVSLAALVLEQGYYVLVSGAAIVKPLAFTVIGIGVVWLAHHGIKRGWLL